MTRLEGVVSIDAIAVVYTSNYASVLGDFEQYVAKQGSLFSSRKELLNAIPTLIDSYSDHLNSKHAVDTQQRIHVLKYSYAQWSSMGLHNTTETWPLNFNQVLELARVCLSNGHSYYASLFLFAYGCQQGPAACDGLNWRHIVNTRITDDSAGVELVVREHRFRLKSRRSLSSQNGDWQGMLIAALNQHCLDYQRRPLGELAGLSQDLLSTKVWPHGAAVHAQQLQEWCRVAGLNDGHVTFGSLREGGILDCTLKKHC